MAMKFYITLFLSIIISLAAFSQQVYVYSFSLLNLRDSTSTSSNILTQLHFGDTVQIVESTNIECPIANLFVKDSIMPNDSSYNENPISENLNLQGHWTKIKYKTFVGFVNSIYLSGLPHLYNLEKKYEAQFKNTAFYTAALKEKTFLLLNNQYNIPSKSALLKPAALFYKRKKNKDKMIEISYNIKYVDGLKFEYEDSYFEDEGSGGYTITISKKGINFEEAVMYARAFFYNMNFGINKKLGYHITEDKKYTITSYGEGGGCEGQVFKNKKGEWVISFGCGGC